MSQPHKDDRPSDSAPNEGRGQQAGESGLTPQLRQWARQQFADEEVVAALREMREHSGKELHEFLHDLDQQVKQP